MSAKSVYDDIHLLTTAIENHIRTVQVGVPSFVGPKK